MFNTVTLYDRHQLPVTSVQLPRVAGQVDVILWNGRPFVYQPTVGRYVERVAYTVPDAPIARFEEFVS